MLELLELIDIWLCCVETYAVYAVSRKTCKTFAFETALHVGTGRFNTAIVQVEWAFIDIYKLMVELFEGKQLTK